MMNKRMKFLAIVLLFIAFLSGCMYPEENLAQNQIPYEEQVNAVQNAVLKFQEDNGGILPIKTKDAETPLYQKYLIDFNRIVPRYLPDVPGNAFEAGGIFQYVLIDVETNPTVKLFDLRMAETIRELKLRFLATEYPPFKEQISKNVFTLDYSKIGYKQDPVAVSPFTGVNLPFVVTGDGEVYVDYRSDLYQKLKANELSMNQGEDIREILLEDSLFVPAYSLPYTVDVESGEPIFLDN